MIKNTPLIPPDRIHLHGLHAKTIIGVYAWERQLRQSVLIDMELAVDVSAAAATDDIKDTLDYKAVTKATTAFVADGRFILLETLAERTAQMLLQQFSLSWLRLKITKQWALRDVRDVSVVIERSARTDDGANA